MRPRLLAVDHQSPPLITAIYLGFNEATAVSRGSQAGPLTPEVPGQASMRPRLLAVDHDEAMVDRISAQIASMRPRLLAVDHSHKTSYVSVSYNGFNEATAVSRGSP